MNTRAALRHSIDVQDKEEGMRFVEGLLDVIYDVAKGANVPMIDGYTRDEWYDEQILMLRGCQRPTAILTHLAATAKHDNFIKQCLDMFEAAVQGR